MGEAEEEEAVDHISILRSQIQNLRSLPFPNLSFPFPSSSIPNLFVFMLFADSVVKHSLSLNRFSSPGMSSLSSKLGPIWGVFWVLSPFLLSGPLQGGHWLTSSPPWTSSSPPSRCLVMPRFFLEVRRLFVNLMCSYFRMWLVRMFGINWTIIWNFEFG